MNKILKNTIPFFFATLYALWLSGLPFSLFADRGNYLSYATDSEGLIDTYKQLGGWVVLFFREPLWLYFNKWLLFLEDPKLTVQIFVFFVCFSLFTFVYKNTKNILLFFAFLIFLFFNVQAFAMQLVTFRQGIGVAFLFWYILLFKEHLTHKKLIVLFTCLALIHASFFIILAIIILDWFLLNYLKFKNVYLRVFTFIIVFLIINILIAQVAKYLGTKAQLNGELNVGGGAFLMYGVIFLYLLFVKSKKQENRIQEFYYIFALSGLVIYLTSYFTSGIGGRLIGTFIPFFYLAIMYRAKMQDLLFVLLLIFVNSYLFFKGAIEGFTKVSVGELLSEIFSFNIL
ncbi:EpsG family protein [Tenacibaculum finnmarkense]|uniref:EpsG family protein n=1 Tax=Tenacibaculum finnmarkense TaxID=2781243 RepID=UPI001EFB8E3A|nr:EpsG family protein [Tenacibaculum finnmarkense]MCG8236934.1 EpsG family protein [Tenacibaculum finnmarkense genomovar ulcerans]MCG8749734.1 hypothetical protein [Tenacibaculum finnmarkense]MCG8754851.1 hypothetical protein [Tenacibaculum finnmarkense]MCG8783765.1 hypothetical protein [Tenacibaculum finnmarkense]MCG8831034.1 hypothetical protein [Tenacibaculum finnmarkense]